MVPLTSLVTTYPSIKFVNILHLHACLLAFYVYYYSKCCHWCIINICFDHACILSCSAKLAHQIQNFILATIYTTYVAMEIHHNMNTFLCIMRWTKDEYAT